MTLRLDDIHGWHNKGTDDKDHQALGSRLVARDSAAVHALSVVTGKSRPLMSFS